jgi:hypothetical protein
LKAKCKENGSQNVISYLAYDLFKESTGLDHQIVKIFAPFSADTSVLHNRSLRTQTSPKTENTNHFVSSPLCCFVAQTIKYNDAADRWSQGSIKAEISE